uniref:alpha-tectorin-like n=1 Tax=Semicossyphus pulcher TaxID=241346 RepID=UPI0037E9AEF6
MIRLLLLLSAVGGLQAGNAAILGEDTKGSNCETISCNSPGISPVIKNCPTNEKCNANNNCEYRATCTFTGPTAIDISGKLTTVKDRCNYILLESTKLLSFKVEGEYRERRRKHISHLENVKLTVDTKVYILKQGGRVEKGDGQLLTLTATETKFDSFSLAKTDAGVTAKYSKDGFEISVYFDGHTLQILTTGPTTKDPGLKKICADINERVAVRTIVDSCDKAQTDADVTKDVCDKAKTSCDVLKSTPFTSCNGVVKPDPYIKACKETMCKYPAEDNLMCSFLEAYARACKVQGRQDVTGFRSSASCPTTHKAFCPGKSCASQEFCALESGDFKCRCRPVFAAPFIKDNLLGDPTVCSANSASVTLINCLLTDKNIDYTTLHLKDKKCPGTFKDGNVTFTFNSDSLCDAEVKATDTEVTYKNNIMSSTDPNAAIIRQDQVNIEFKCTQTQPAIQSFSFKLQRSSVSKEVKSGSYDYTVSIEAFTDAARLQAVTEVVLNQKVYVNVKTTGLDDKVIAVVIDSCYASKDSDPTKDPKYQLITAGCANKEDNTVTVVGNGVSTSSYFSFNVFQFPNSNGDVHLHCKVKLCSTQGKSCLPDCTKQRRRRNAMPMYLDEAFITMAWNS